MDRTNQRWGVYAWTHTPEGVTNARINNTFRTEAEAKEASKDFAFYGYDSLVVIPEPFFGHAWDMIGANTQPEDGPEAGEEGGEAE